MFCNLEGLKSAVGARVRWHTSVQGNEVDVHNAHWCASVPCRMLCSRMLLIGTMACQGRCEVTPRTPDAYAA
jgi:hypothetical protein